MSRTDDTTQAAGGRRPRPLSPHLQVYRPQITSVTSILHRMTGAVMALGLFVVVWGLVALAGGPDTFETFRGILSSIPGQIVLIGWSAAFFYHLLSGIRHLVRDAGYLYTNAQSCVTGYAIVGLTALATVCFWGAIYGGLI